jgi:Ca-activated chloride channel family protein
LLDEIRLRGENAELKDEVTALARQYSIVTPYTAWLITEDEARRGVALERRLLPQLRSDREAGEQAARSYDSFKRLKDGDVAVGGAQLARELKAAEAPVVAQFNANASVARSYGAVATAPAVVPPANTPSGRVVASPAPVVVSKPTSDAAARVAQYAQQNRFVAGKSFYQNGAQWVDAEAQQLKDAKPVKLPFGSTEYFALLAKHPVTAQWLALGRNVQFVLSGTLYEVTE